MPETSDTNVYEGLRSRLGLDRPLEDLGFVEQRFNTCDYNLTPAEGCKDQYISVIHFQLLCRESEGTIQDVPDVFPVASSQVNFKLGRVSGGTSTDANGYGRVTVVSDHSYRNERLILRIGKQFMGVTVSEINRLILPQNWCTH